MNETALILSAFENRPRAFNFSNVVGEEVECASI